MKKFLICLLIGLSVMVARQYVSKSSLMESRELPGRVAECEPPEVDGGGGPDCG